MQTGKLRILPQVFLVKNTEVGSPQFSDFKVEKNTEPFTKVLFLTEKQKAFTNKWQLIMQHELSKPVNFSGHYQLSLSWNGELPKECGDDRWVCGWILDKKTGEVVSTLPELNGDTAYFSYNDNGTPRPDEFSPQYTQIALCYGSQALMCPLKEVVMMNAPSLPTTSRKISSHHYFIPDVKWTGVMI